MRIAIAVMLTAFTFNFSCAQDQSKVNSDDKQIMRVRGEIFTTRANPKVLPLAREDGAFHFAIYGDRTGGNPAGLKFLRQAVQDTNLMDPDFVMTVGDLIQGYNRPAEWMTQMKEFQDIMSGLNMNWFPVAGNHDIYWDFRDRNRPGIHHEANYEKHFGPLWYSFQHKNCGFIVLYSDEGNPESGEKGFREARLQNVSPEQFKFIDSALKKLSNCDQVFVFLHHPRWLGGGYAGSNWPEVHRRLVNAGNVRGVFAGHIHHLTFEGPVDGIEYYTLATTGAHLSMDSPELGYLHHFNMVTVRDDDFTVATVPVGTVIDPRTFKMDFLNDVDIVRNMRPSRIGNRLQISLESSAASDYSLSVTNPGKFPIEVTITPQLYGKWQVLPDHQHVVVPPGKSQGMRFHFHRRSDTDLGWSNFQIPALSMNVDYLHSSARIRIPEVSLPVEVKLAQSDISFETDMRKCLSLRGVQSASPRRPIFKYPNDSVKINSSDVPLPQGPFTIEAWVKASSIEGSQAIIAKTQSSEYAIFLHEGLPQFDVNINGKYVSPSSEDSLQIDKWTHVAGVYDGQEARLYLDGQRVQSLFCKGTRTTNDLPLFIGADPDGFGNPTREFAGQIDEVRISRTVRYTSNFSPQKRFKRDPDTVVLLHLDQAYGPFLFNDSDSESTVLKLGRASIAPCK